MRRQQSTLVPKARYRGPGPNRCGLGAEEGPLALRLAPAHVLLDQPAAAPSWVEPGPRKHRRSRPAEENGWDGSWARSESKMAWFVVVERVTTAIEGDVVSS
ncbi:hypothetical protein EDB83DRAFT_2321945 [Lactarius deliciosus]|nr:hypothetical protein EDB83DRAFT_2321945 [Lactarius deliciosus]